jgi:tol-pal system protein YbgF
MSRSWCYAPLLAIAAIALTGCETTAEPDPTETKLNDVDQRLVRVERNNESLLRLSARIDELETQQRDLRGMLEELQNSTETLRKQQRDLYADLERRLAASQSSSAPSTGGGGVSGATYSGSAAGAAVSDSGDQAAYARAFDALKNNDYDSAIARFKEFLRTYPQSTLAGNAQYWLGEAYSVTRDLDSAAASFQAVGDQYPKSAKVPDALLKLGLTQVEQRKLTDAHATLTQVVQKYPGTDAARLAAARLQNLPPG